MVVHINPASRSLFEIVSIKSGIPFSITGDNHYALALMFESETSFSQLFNWLSVNSINKTQADFASSRGSINVKGHSLYNISDFEVFNQTFKVLEPHFKNYFIDKIKPENLIKFVNSQELNAALSNLNSFDRKVNEGYFKIEIDDRDVTGVINVDGILKIIIYSQAGDFLPHAEIFTTRLPEEFSNKQIIEFIKKYLTDTDYRFNEIKKCLDDFIVSFHQSRDAETPEEQEG